ncbi:MAG: DinB family protein [Planctomycetes bacterium]|nr:DinB family protein [Planctomycetota bacterium]
MTLLDDVLPILRSTPDVVLALLARQPAAEIGFRPDGQWNSAEILAHLIHGERTDWIPRVRHLLAHADREPFPPFDRDGWGDLVARPLPELLETFAVERRGSLAAFASLGLTETDLARVGLHPRLGRVTLANLLATWGVHDLTHIDQLTRLQAQRLGEPTGPWNHPDFLGILHRRKPRG